MPKINFQKTEPYFRIPNQMNFILKLMRVSHSIYLRNLFSLNPIIYERILGKFKINLELE